MIRHLSHDDWLAARRELAAIIGETRRRGVIHVEPLLVQAQRALTLEGSPTLAGSELETVADQIKEHPDLQRRIGALSVRIIGFEFAEADESHLITPPRGED